MQGFNYLQAQAYVIQTDITFSLNLENNFLKITNSIILIHKVIYLKKIWRNMLIYFMLFFPNKLSC